MRKPKTYWEDRAVNAEEGVMRLSEILARHFPAMRQELRSHASEWKRVIEEIETAYPEAAEPDVTKEP